MKKHWSHFEHKLWHELKTYSFESSPLIIALSGGSDSMALAHALMNVLGPELISVAHFHHGDGEQVRADDGDKSSGLTVARDQAYQFCRDWAQKNNIKFYLNKWPGPVLKSEAQMREKRYEFLLGLYRDLKPAAIVTAHHLDDVLETRMIRLLRGTGPQGLKAIEVLRAPFFRPMLQVSKSEILVYINKQNLKFVTDPSNSDSVYLRNWLRNKWLPQLERKRPGSTERLGRSLEALVQSLPIENSSEPQDCIPRSEFLAQTEAQQVRWLARALLHSGRRDFTQFHLQEIRRRLLLAPKSNSFKVAGCEWLINAQQIRVQLA